MKMQKKMLILVLAVVLLISVLPLNVSAEDDFTKVLAETKKGVVQVYGLGSDGYGWSSWIGTGFAVGEEGKDSDVFLTNWHVVTCSGEYDLSQVRIWILQENCCIDQYTGEPDPQNSISCEVMKTTTGYPDYAIIRATESVSGYKALPLLHSEDIADGTTVYALGYPSVVGDASVNHYGIDDITSTNGIISQHMQFAYAENTWVLTHTAQISGGNSGGPLITEKGAVVGLNTYGFGELADRYCAVYIDYAMEGLDELGLEYDLYEEKITPDNMGVILAIVGAVGVVIAGAGLAIYLKKKKEQEQEEARRRLEAQRRQEEERRRQEEECRHQAEIRRRAQMVRAKVQMNGGMIYPVNAAGGTIGREKDCMIVLPEKTPGVSRHHCKLEVRGEQLVLIDLNSSFGTYIHGKRVPPNTPIALRVGSSFSLGSDKVCFTVI